MPSLADSLDGACDVRFGQVGLACVRLRHANADGLREALARRVESAPALFSRTAVVLDFSHLDTLPDAAAAGSIERARFRSHSWTAGKQNSTRRAR